MKDQGIELLSQSPMSAAGATLLLKGAGLGSVATQAEGLFSSSPAKPVPSLAQELREK